MHSSLLKKGDCKEIQWQMALKLKMLARLLSDTVDGHLKNTAHSCRLTGSDFSDFIPNIKTDVDFFFTGDGGGGRG